MIYVLTDYLVQLIKDRGWLAISSIYFDNSYIINVFNTSGYVAYSPSQKVYMSYNSIDSTDSEAIESRYCLIPMRRSSFQMALTFADEACLQHFDVAAYAHYGFLYEDTKDTAAFAKVPTPADLAALTYDETTGLYSGPKVEIVAERLSGMEQSIIPLYGDDFDYFKKGEPFSGARVENWISFYRNHEKFKTLLANQFGIADAI